MRNSPVRARFEWFIAEFFSPLPKGGDHYVEPFISHDAHKVLVPGNVPATGLRGPVEAGLTTVGFGESWGKHC